jgi:hypothetical protein
MVAPYRLRLLGSVRPLKRLSEQGKEAYLARLITPQNYNCIDAFGYIFAHQYNCIDTTPILSRAAGRQKFRRQGAYIPHNRQNAEKSGRNRRTRGKKVCFCRQTACTALLCCCYIDIFALFLSANCNPVDMAFRALSGARIARRFVCCPVDILYRILSLHCDYINIFEKTPTYIDKKGEKHRGKETVRPWQRH